MTHCKLKKVQIIWDNGNSDDDNDNDNDTDDIGKEQYSMECQKQSWIA